MVFIDKELSLTHVNGDVYSEIAKLAPFGMNNPKPIFLFKNIRPISKRIFGKTNNHIELIFERDDGRKIAAISFFGAESDWAKKIEVGKSIDLIASIEKSVFRGRTELRLRIADIIFS